ncbi:MAG: SUMF1/EgtB/PvdO family nonheme iron enzyme [Cyclobacteriaceae bacterium]|nr:SUMF1/EgtB/PvdO family nonheme iron enzyme [Cyclobacteriaceae bacterium]
MCIKFNIGKLILFLGILATAGLSSCSLLGIGGGGAGGGDAGQVRDGIPGREGWAMVNPYGMVPVPAGTFHMGQTDEDPASTQINFNKQVTIGQFFIDDSEITNNEYRQYIYYMRDKLSASMGPLPYDQQLRDFVDQKIDTTTWGLYPDTTVFVRDFAHHMGDPLQDYYFWHPGYDDYPVVGVSWVQATMFSDWRTLYWNEFRKYNAEPVMPAFRLPSEAEWEYAARGGRDMAKYPWGGPYIRNSLGCMLANFKPGRGNFYDDGYAYTAPIRSFFPNDYGIYDMAGNVAEWCLDEFNPASVPTVWDLNPQYIVDAANPKHVKFDPSYVSMKVIRGGSWKDIAYYLQTGTRTYEYRDTAKAFIGFRNAMVHLGRSSGFEF